MKHRKTQSNYYQKLLEIKKEFVREDARVLKIEEKSIVEHKSSPGEEDMGFDDLCSTIDFYSIF